jgi:hypothetical protein
LALAQAETLTAPTRSLTRLPPLAVVLVGQATMTQVILEALAVVELETIF